MTALMDVLQGAIDIDTNIFLFINGMHNTFFDYFMSAYSGKWVWVPMYAAIWYVMLRNFHWKVTLFCMVGLALDPEKCERANDLGNDGESGVCWRKWGGLVILEPLYSLV